MKQTIRTYCKYTLILASALTVAGSTAALAQISPTASPSAAPSSSTTDHKTTKFLKEAAADNEKEISMAQLGISKAQNAELKAFSQQILQDHQKAKTQLSTLVSQHNVTLDPQDKKADKEMAKLEKLAGAEFDKEFATAALKDHHKDIAAYQKATEQVQAPDVEQFARQTLPTLRQHLQHATRVAQAVGVDQATITALSKPGREAVGGSTDTGEDTINSSSKDPKGHELQNNQSPPPK